jgi:hypothetical protein
MVSALPIVCMHRSNGFNLTLSDRKPENEFHMVATLLCCVQQIIEQELRIIPRSVTVHHSRILSWH